MGRIWEMSRSKNHAAFEIWINGEHATDAVRADENTGEAIVMISERDNELLGFFGGYRRDGFGRVACERILGRVEIRKCNPVKGDSKPGPEIWDPIACFIVGTNETFSVGGKPQLQVA